MDIAGTLWDACVLALSCVYLVLINYKIVIRVDIRDSKNSRYKILDICKFTVSAFCTKTRLFNLGSNGGSLLSDIFRYFYCYCHCTNVDFPTFIVSVSSRGTAASYERGRFL